MGKNKTIKVTLMVFAASLIGALILLSYLYFNTSMYEKQNLISNMQKYAEEKYNSSAGKYQEIEGPPIAEEMLTKLGYDKNVIERVSYLVGHHHTYSNIDGIDYQILVEADFLVNIDEDEMTKETAENVREKIFKTKSGTQILDNLFLTELIK